MAAPDYILSVPSIAEYRLRRDSRQQALRLQASFLEDDTLHSLSGEEFRAYIYVLCEAVKSGKGEFPIYSDRAEVLARVPPKALASMLSKVDKITKIKVTSKLLQSNMQVTHSASRVILDFESLYREYPRKMGKSKGIEKCKVQIKTEEDFNLLSQAIKNYSAHCVKEATETRYIKHFASFMSSWRDWLDKDVGSAIRTAPLTWLEEYGDKD